MSRREEAKAERRHRIVTAARDLVRETGEAGLSMRAIAARAQVAITTPYNLFGSKHAIVIALLDDLRRFQERFAAVSDVDPVERIFQAVNLSLAYLADDPDLYRTLWTEVLRSDNLALRSELSSPQRRAFWHDLLTAAKQDGSLLDWIDVDALLPTLDSVYGSAMIAWALGHIPLHHVEPRIGYGYALALRGAANDATRAGLESRLRTFQARLGGITAPTG